MSTQLKKGIDFIGVGCGALIVNDNNETLLMKRGGDSRNETGIWSQPGGGVDFGEKIEDAIKREVKEELGVTIELHDFLTVTDHIIPGENQHWVSVSYLGKIVSGKPAILEQEKCSEIKWFALNNLPENLTQPTKESVEAYKKLNNAGV